ncbi:MAG: DUF4301 family protein [Flavobacteriaceae bacterium]|nr:MAG: DUF4301 family protein [Flavobacteriaceae bacterium]
MIEFSPMDMKQLEEKGISKKKVLDQIEIFKEGIPFVRLEKAAIVSDGIKKLTKAREKILVGKFDELKVLLSVLKFVPASGAASRMFKSLFNFLEHYDPSKESVDAYIERLSDTDLRTFFKQIKKFPFYEVVQERIKNKAGSGNDLKYLFVSEMLREDGLNYGFYPKGLLPFHNYGKFTATPFEEHLKEASAYGAVNNKAKLHFTISAQHHTLFNEEFKTAGPRVSKATKTEFEVTYSYQKASTDTIAVTLDNKPFKKEDGSVLFRPGGHGALIENLNEQNADIIFIKNIDNVVIPEHEAELAISKKILAGLLLEVQQKAFAYADQLDRNDITGEQLHEIRTFLENDLNVRFLESFSSFSISEQLEILKDKINRPIRVCGMVKNEGEPGGGPFWIRDAHDHISLQIVESAQIDSSDEGQMTILKNSTHFNPVDIVCGVRNFRGEKYNLLNFVDTKQGFITLKTQDGKELKALELPGLWNGAMAFWNTIFVEVPLLTFNPVKTVNDLLKPTHQVT